MIQKDAAVKINGRKAQHLPQHNYSLSYIVGDTTYDRELIFNKFHYHGLHLFLTPPLFVPILHQKEACGLKK